MAVLPPKKRVFILLIFAKTCEDKEQITSSCWMKRLILKDGF